MQEISKYFHYDIDIILWKGIFLHAFTQKLKNICFHDACHFVGFAGSASVRAR